MTTVRASFDDAKRICWPQHRSAAAALLAVTLLFLLPFYWVLAHSFESTAEFARNQPRLWPAHPTLNNYYIVLVKDDFTRYLVNSLIVASITAAITVVSGSLAGYAIARYPMRGRGVILGFVILAGFFPLTAMMGPLFEVMVRLRLLDTLPGVHSRVA